MLTASDLTRYEPGGPVGAPTLADTYDGPACSGQPTTLGFLEHANDRLPALDSSDVGRYYTAINPTFSTEPHSSYGC